MFGGMQRRSSITFELIRAAAYSRSHEITLSADILLVLTLLVPVDIVRQIPTSIERVVVHYWTRVGLRYVLLMK